MSGVGDAEGGPWERLSRWAKDSLRAGNQALQARTGVALGRPGAVAPNAAWFAKLFYFHRLLTELADIRGTVVECGVGEGSSLATLASLCRELGQPRAMWGFDSWEGLPSPDAQDLTSDGSVARPGLFAETTRTYVLNRLRAHGFEDQVGTTIHLVAGRFEDTLGSYDGGQIALLNVDADLYDSYRVCLETLWPSLAEGGIAAFDEYHQEDLWPGARRAVDEFVSSLPSGAAELRTDPVLGRVHAVKTASR